ncbi:MAG: hypothetical protein MUO50_18170 [Longimicrobiales bacterium]|nr:hypothetical protein [Longimicrobiales bacterium]
MREHHAPREEVIGMALLRRLFLFGSGLLCACTSSLDSPSATFSVDTLPNGTVSVTNTGVSSWEGRAWTARETLRIGTVHGGGPAQFAVISDLAVDEDGKIFVAEIQAGEIRVFNADGSFSHSFGGPGEGPGEFRALTGLTLSPVGMVWAQDARIHRFSVFTPDGQLMAVHPMKYRGYLVPWEPGFDTDGRLLDWETPRPRNLGGSADIARYPFVPVRVGEDFESLERFPPVVDHPRMMASLGMPKVNDGHVIIHTDHLGTFWFADPDEYRVFRRSPAGDTSLTFTLPAEPEQVTEEERDSLLFTRVDGRRLSADDVILEKPVLRRITTSPDGYFLAFPRMRGIPEGTVVDVFDLSGQYVGRIDLPSKLGMRPVPVLMSSHLYGVTKDEFDVPYVVRFRIDGMPSPGKDSENE